MAKNRFGDEIEESTPSQSASAPAVNRFGDVIEDGQAPASPVPSAQNHLAAGLSTLPQSTLSSGPEPSFAQFFQNAADDIKYGNTSTWIGKLFRGMGGQPTHNNVPPAVGDLMASPVLGPLQTGKGVGQVAQGKVLRGGANIVGGALDTVSLPMMVLGAGAAGPSNTASRAAELIETAETAAGHVPVDVSDAANIALRGQEIGEAGGGGSKLFNNFVSRFTNPKKAQMTLAQARDFAKNANALSQKAEQNMSGPMRAQLAQFKQALYDAIIKGAKTVGQDQNLSNGLDMYRKVMQNKAMVQAVKQGVTKNAGKAISGAVGGGAGAYEMYRWLNSGKKK
jgi:hypothetical protein